MYLENYLNDGANHQAQAVMALLKPFAHIEQSWNDETNKYTAKIEIGRWENGREQGYILSLKNQERRQLNIAFFEHRNSDSIHALKWVQNSMNSINIDSIEEGVYESKYDTTYSVEYGKILEMANWIKEQFQLWYNIGYTE